MPARASGTGLSPPAARLSSRFPSPLPCNTAVLQPPACVATRRVWAPPRSLAATGGIIALFSFPPGTKMFQFPGLALPHKAEVPVLQTGGLSHSEIRGSTVTCTYPRLVAACHVLRRLREPRHPPCALNYFLAVAACPRTWAGRRRGEGQKAGHPINAPSIPAECGSSYFQLFCSFATRPQHPARGADGSRLSTLQSCLCQYVKDRRGMPAGRNGARGPASGKRRRGVENIGVEPMTSCMPCKRSSQLS